MFENKNFNFFTAFIGTANQIWVQWKEYLILCDFNSIMIKHVTYKKDPMNSSSEDI